MATASLSRSQRLARELIGKRCGRLVVVTSAGFTPQKDRLFYCRCDCGRGCVVKGGTLRRGVTQSCGCLRAERAREATKKDRPNRSFPEYAVWKGLRRRCEEKGNKSERWYKDRGITVCQEWLNSFDIFYRDMGPRPDARHSIERKDNDRGYCPENCVWATATDQANNRRSNRRIVVGGVEMTVAQAARKFSVNVSTILDRLGRDWDAERAATTPPRQINKRPQPFSAPGLLAESIRRAEAVPDLAA